MDLSFHPYCQRCSREAAITLGDLKLSTARRFTAALEFGT